MVWWAVGKCTASFAEARCSSLIWRLAQMFTSCFSLFLHSKDILCTLFPISFTSMTFLWSYRPHVLPNRLNYCPCYPANLLQLDLCVIVLSRRLLQILHICDSLTSCLEASFSATNIPDWLILCALWITNWQLVVNSFSHMLNVGFSPQVILLPFSQLRTLSILLLAHQDPTTLAE